MTNPKYLRDSFEFCLSHVVEEAGEMLAAAGKTQRWGWSSINPELKPGDPLYGETNLDWLKREMNDLRGAMDRLDKVIDEDRLP